MRIVDGMPYQRPESEDALISDLRALFDSSPIHLAPTWDYQMIAYLRRQTLSRLLYWDQLYRQIVDVPGAIVEMGVMYGATLSTLTSLRGIYEPYNYERKLYGFDTFSGFPVVTPEDGGHWDVGDHATPSGYEDHLRALLSVQEGFSPLSEIEKSKLIVGDVSETLPQWLAENPGQMVAMAIFDMDIYQPTRDALEAIEPRLTKGSIVVFDELTCEAFPGEFRAFQEVVGSKNVRLRRSPLLATCGWYVVGE